MNITWHWETEPTLIDQWDTDTYLINSKSEQQVTTKTFPQIANHYRPMETIIKVNINILIKDHKAMITVKSSRDIAIQAPSLAIILLHTEPYYNEDDPLNYIMSPTSDDFARLFGNWKVQISKLPTRLLLEIRSLIMKQVQPGTACPWVHCDTPSPQLTNQATIQPITNTLTNN